MTKVKKISLILGTLLLVVGSTFYIVGLVNPKSAGLKIDTSPAALVYLNGEQVGRTPYDETVKAGETVVKLVPDLEGTPLTPYETKIALAGGIQTVIIRNFAETNELASGAIISYTKESTGSALSVISMPDAAQIAIDGLTVGFTPFKSSTIAEGDHLVTVSYPGYLPQSQSVRVVRGYNLTAYFSLAVDPNKPPEEEVVESEEEEEVMVVQIEILDTPTGFLRVRSGPSTLDSEVAQVEPGDIFDLLEETEDGEWFKIKIDDTLEGYVSATYATKLYEEVQPGE